jgi:hypothetical protein
MTAVYCMLHVMFGTCLTNGQATANEFVDVYPDHAARAPVWIAHNVCGNFIIVQFLTDTCTLHVSAVKCYWCPSRLQHTC